MMFKIMREVCLQDLWPAKLSLNTASFVKQFSSFRDMIKSRPFVRFDGVYVNKMHYVRYGQSEVSEYRPSFDVYSWRYLRFFSNGTMI